VSTLDERTGLPGSRSLRLTPEAVRRTSFERTGIGRRGYVESDVERFLVRVADAIAWSDAEKADLRAEIDRLRNYFRDQAATGNASAPPTTPGEPSVQAVNALSLAQQAADQHIAQAEAYARNLLGTAREQYEAILHDAHDQAQAAATAAAEAYLAADQAHSQVSQQADLEAKVAYLRTFAEVTQVQMRSILEALRSELDRLTHYDVRTTAAPEPVEPAGLFGPPTGSSYRPQAGTQSGGQAGTQSGGQAGTQSGGQAGTQSGGQAGTQSGGQAGGQESMSTSTSGSLPVIDLTGVRGAAGVQRPS
jgi:cell division initiation protein